MNDGGPAFPIVEHDVISHRGMSLRAYMATAIAAAMAEKLMDETAKRAEQLKAGSPSLPGDDRPYNEKLARFSCILADALIEELQKGQ